MIRIQWIWLALGKLWGSGILCQGLSGWAIILAGRVSRWEAGPVVPLASSIPNVTQQPAGQSPGTAVPVVQRSCRKSPFLPAAPGTRPRRPKEERPTPWTNLSS
ncbi:hypothetical protein VTN96DRAFT_656 [Rasamsonia emersonii]